MMIRLILVIMVLHVGTIAGLTPCPNQAYPHWFKLGDVCARYFAYEFNFADAETRCGGEAAGGHLISIHDEQTSEDVQILTGSSYTRVWIGGFKIPHSGKFVWTDGSNWDYTNWVQGEPNGNGDCVQINYDTPGKWDDVQCWSSRGYVCAFKI
ncbi:hypothetical protein AALO_G00253380 [Alosa alosa]|uniref:C-type lectin domain-containing protein n=1 Tax=Alosa alosa TaxID=278164 RepID=A0AAV6FPC5_9TELE|nr:hypothetical protein AALO_G00253380 [Alosa alosa]